MEVWKDIEGFEGKYQISNLGRVKSLERYVNSKSGSLRLVKERIMRFEYLNSDHYKIVTLSKINNFQKSIHYLVAFHFIENPENKPQVNHKNGNRHDNRVENLEWVTASENSIHAIKTGLKIIKYNEECPSSKLTLEQALKIKYEYKGMRQWEIAEIYGLNQSTISDVRTGRRWKGI